MEPVKVCIYGALGRVGQVMVSGLSREPGIKVVGAVDIKAVQDSLILPDGSGIPLSDNPATVIDKAKPDVLVDFSVAQAVMPGVRTATQRGVHMVIGTTGLGANELSEIDQIAKASGVGVVVAPNFALGAVLMMHMAKVAAKYMDYAEIIELHHHLKLDAPSGTALSTAEAMAEARGKPFKVPEQAKASPSRGQLVQGVSIHSVRLQGLLAHQEVILGGLGQTLSIRHDTISRECYIPGVALAVKEVIKRKGLTYGLDTLLGL